MGQLALPTGGLVCLDADAVIYSVEKISPYDNLLAPLWQAARSGELTVAGSELLLMETLVGPLRSGDQDLAGIFLRLLTTTEVRLLPISREILLQAAALRSSYGLRSPDAIHAATALVAGCDMFITNDRGLKRVPELPLTILDEILG